MTSTNTQQESPSLCEQDESAASSTMCPVVWTDIWVPNSTAFDPTGATRLYIFADAFVNCSDSNNADYQFAILLWASDSPDAIQDPSTALLYSAYNGTQKCPWPLAKLC